MSLVHVNQAKVFAFNVCISIIVLNNLDPGFSKEVSDPTPKIFDETGFTERSRHDSPPEAGSILPRNQSESYLLSMAPFGHCGQAEHAPVTRCYSSSQLQNIYPGDLYSLLSLQSLGKFGNRTLMPSQLERNYAFHKGNLE